MPRHSRLSDSEKKRRRRERDRMRNAAKKARLNPPPTQEEEQENRERRLEQQAQYVRQRRERDRSQRENQLIVGGDGRQEAADTNEILQEMNIENHADRLQHVLNAPRNPVANAATLPQGLIVDGQQDENDSVPPPPPRPLPHPMTILTTPMNPLVLGPLLPDPMDYNHRSAIRRNIDRA